MQASDLESALDLKRAEFTERMRIAGFAKRQSGEVWDVILMLKEL